MPKLPKLKSTLILYLLSILTLLLAATLFYFSFFPLKISFEKYPEINYLENKELNFAQLKTYFKEIADKKGAVYAFEVLKHSPMPANTDLHLLGHVVGEILYLQKGAEGMKFCTPDFRNACSHTIVVGLFLDKGEAALTEINKACKKAPGGSGAYLMCHHGLGHGIFAFTNYQLPKTVELCKKTATKQYQFKEYPECVGGAIMEQISGGDHDKPTWANQKKVNLKESDPLYPCNSEIIPDTEAKRLCLLYLTPHLFNLAEDNPGGKPNDEAITKAFTFCENIPEHFTQDRDVCFGGFGKEFVVLAKDRDIRKIENMTTTELKQVLAWCELTSNKLGQQSCIEYTVGSLFWGGENKRHIAVKFCNLNTKHQSSCFQTLTNNIKMYVKDKTYRNEFCSELPPAYQEDCTKTLL